VDQQFADYEEELRKLEAEIRFLQCDLAFARLALANAKNATAESQSALHAAHKIIADHEMVIGQLAQVNHELEQEFIHCQKHHLPPPTPSKSKDLEIPFSAFNFDANRASVFPKVVDVSKIHKGGSSLIPNPETPPKLSTPFTTPKATTSPAPRSPLSGGGQTIPKPSSPSSNNTTPKSVAAIASPIAKLPSEAGSPYAKPCNPIYNATPPKFYIPLTAKALSAVASFCPTSDTDDTISETFQLTPLGYVQVLSTEPKQSRTTEVKEAQRPKSARGLRPRPLHPHSLRQNLYLHGPLSS
jgi:hypothetical protein